MDFDTRRKYYNRCKPDESLAPRDERNVDFDAIGPESERPRGVVWVERLAMRIALSDEPTCILFTGLPGSGKSTELRRLKARLSSGDANMLSVLVDAEDVLDLTRPIDIPDIIAIAVHAAEREVLRAEGGDPDRALTEGYLVRFVRWLTETDVGFGKADLNIPIAGRLVVEMKTRPSFRERVRRVVGAHLTTFLAQAGDELRALQTRARALGYRDLLIVFDSLEKLRGISTTWHEVLQSAEQIFGSGAPYLELPVHVIYTVPAALVGRNFHAVDFMPMVKLRQRDGTPFAPGIAAMRELVRRRIPDDAMRALLGDAFEDRIRALIMRSGGYPREIMRALQAICATAELPLSEPGFERVQNETRDTYRRIIPANSFDWLAQVAREKYLTVENEDHRESADLMLSNNVVLRYLNQRDWYDLHPAVYDVPGVTRAIERMEGRLDGRPETAPETGSDAAPGPRED